MNKENLIYELNKKKNKLIDEVCSDLKDLKTIGEIESYLEDVVNYGCISGVVSKLIYYMDTNKFYDRNEEEIEDLIREFKIELGYKKRSEFIASLNGSAESITEEKNLLSWLAYEETARKILYILEEEIKK